MPFSCIMYAHICDEFGIIECHLYDVSKVGFVNVCSESLQETCIMCFRLFYALNQLQNLQSSELKTCNVIQELDGIKAIGQLFFP